MVALYLIIAAIIAIACFWGFSSYHFNKMIHQEINNVAHSEPGDSLELFNHGDLMRIPAPVRRYLKNAIPDGYPIIRTVELTHEGFFKTAPNKDWSPIKGEEYFSTDPPAYLWIGNLQPSPILWLKARDKYINGEAEVLVRLYSGLTVSKMNGSEVNLSALIRFAGEIPWFPTAFTNESYLQWQPIDDRSARAVINDHENQVTVTYYFNNDDEVERFFTQDRYYNGQKQDYTGCYRNYREINGIRIPTEVEVVWNLPDGDFSYARFTLTNIIYNKFATNHESSPHPITAQ